MRVAMYYNNRDVRIEEIPVPEIGPDELLVKVIASGICGSDVMEWYRIKKAPSVLGHEITGEIIKRGENVKNYKEGDRVFVSHHVPCNNCHYCLNGHHTACELLHRTNYDPGGFSEYIRVPNLNVERGVYLLPKEISFDEGTLIEPLACVVRALRIARFGPGQSILIIGCGISGLLFIKLVNALGAGQIIGADINEYRLQKARDYGAQIIINARDNIHASLLRLNNNKKVDLVAVCTGAPSAAIEALKCVDRGGAVLFFAVPEPGVTIPVPLTDLWRNEITMMTSYGASPLDIEQAIKLIQNRRVSLNEMITHRLSLEETGLGFQLVAEAKESIKVIIKPHEYR
jgi:L-iditol 2-dehydrogenase